MTPLSTQILTDADLPRVETDQLPSLFYSKHAADDWIRAVGQMEGKFAQLWQNDGDLIDYRILGPARNMQGHLGINVVELVDGQPEGRHLFIAADAISSINLHDSDEYGANLPAHLRFAESRA